MPTMTDGTVVYEPTQNTKRFDVEYFNTKYRIWQNAHGTWTFDGIDYTLKQSYYSDHPAYEMADLFAYNGYRVRVVEYDVNEENEED